MTSFRRLALVIPGLALALSLNPSSAFGDDAPAKADPAALPAPLSGYQDEGTFALVQKEMRLALQAVGRKLAMFLRRRDRVKHEGQRRQIFLRPLASPKRPA